MAIDRDILREEIKRQVKTYQEFIKGVKPIPSMEELRQIVINDKELLGLYSREDIDAVMEEYCSIVEQIKEQYTNPMNSDKKNILNILEYIRFMSTYENIKDQGIYAPTTSLSQSSISSVFLGKGVCASQARQMRDILPMDSKVKCVCFFDEEEGYENMILEQHDVVISMVEGKEKYIDPTWYNGTTKSLKGSNGKVEHGEQQYESIEATQEEINESKMEVALKIIKELGIDEISKKLQLEGMDDIKKQCAIFTYIEKGVDVKDCGLTHLTTQINGRNIEVGKAIELFFISNSIQYSLVPSTSDKAESILNMRVNEKDVCLIPKHMYNFKTGRLTQTLHGQIKDNRFVPIWNDSPELKDEYRMAIREGMEKASGIYGKVDIKGIIKDDIKKAQISKQELIDLSKSVEKDVEGEKDKKDKSNTK